MTGSEVAATSSPAARQEPVAPSPAAVLLATLIGNLYLLIASIVMGTLAVLVAWIPPARYWSWWSARIWAQGVLLSSGVRLDVDRAELGGGKSYVLMPNHTSLLDIPVLLASSARPVCFVAKRQLFSIPFFGWGLRAAGYIPVDREDRSRAAEVIQTATKRIGQGFSVVIFPEETRSPDGRLLEFKRGGFLLALKARAAIVPVGIRDCFRVRSKGGLVIRPGRIRVRYGDPIDVAAAGLGRKRDMIAQVRREVASLAGLEPELDESA